VTGLAIRLARAATGHRHVLQSGYHGHHEWSAFVLRDGGVLTETKQYTHAFPYNDLQTIVDLVERFDGDVAAIVVETAFEEPRGSFLQDMRRLCSSRGIALIFDEMWTGFRVALGGSQQYYGV